ncbi:MAG: tetratricopeptide repeat protein [Candidatus Pacebacteria bacterium]|nr:tetratricopeptide repeat protein [Candidatus Paceibacterota bacterium]
MYNRIIKFLINSLVFLLPLSWLPFSFEAFEFNKQYILFFLTTLTLLAWIAKMVIVDKELKFRRTPLDLPILAFLFISILSSVFSVDKISSIFGFYGRFSDGLIGLTSLVMLYFLITNNTEVRNKVQSLKAKAEEKRDQLLFSVDELLKPFVWSSFFVILVSYLSVFGLWAKISSLVGNKLPALMVQRIFNPVAGSMEGLSVFLSVFMAFLIGRILTKPSEEKKGNLFSYILLVLSFGLMILIDFNPAWMVLAASLILFVGIALIKRAFREDVNKLLLPLVFAILSLVLIFVNTSSIQTFLFKGQLPQEQVLSMNESWKVGFKGAIENVKSGFVGSGPGTFNYDFAKFKSSSFNQNSLWQIRFDRPGTHFAEILGTTGFLGLISWIILIALFLMMSYFLIQKDSGNLALFIAFLAILASQVFFYQNTVLAFSFWFILGLAVVGWQKPVQEKTITFKDFPELSLVFSALMIVCSLVFMGAYFFAVKFYLADAQYVKAIIAGSSANLEKAVALNPQQPQYKIVLARDYLSRILAENQKAAEERDQAALSVYVQRAIAYAKGGPVSTGNEIINVKGAADLSPNRVAAWETAGMVYRDILGMASGEVLGWGVKSFEKAISLEPTNPVLYTELGKLYLATEDIENAKAKFLKAKELKSTYIDAVVQLASLMSEKENNNEAAISEMENLFTVYPYNTEVLFQLGRFYFNAQRVDEAIVQFENVVALMPNHSNAHYSLGIAYQKKGQNDKAIAEFEKVLELNPGNTDVQDKIDSLK